MRDCCQEVTAEVSPMLHHPHMWSSDHSVAVAPALPSLCAQPPPGTCVPQLDDAELMAAVTPSQPLAEYLPALCLCLQITSSGLRHGLEGFLFVEHEQMRRGLEMFKVVFPDEEKIMQCVEMTVPLDMSQGSFLLGLGHSVTDLV